MQNVNLNKSNVKIFCWIENQIDRITPKVEATARSNRTFPRNEFANIMATISSELKLHLRWKSESVYIFDFTGSILGELSQAKILMGKKAKPNMYQKMKSRYKFYLTEDGFIEVSSFEHMLGFKKERLAFQEVLIYRLNLVLDMINAS